jgi:hypothetical protein|tara:strand:- start:162 stop:386 length:225 start_codon:yes stop_codon:yes gene_type:complete
MSENNNSGGYSIALTIFIIFLTLKLAEVGQVATWSWWWVTSPLWIPVFLAVIVLIIGLIVGLLEVLFDEIQKNK